VGETVKEGKRLLRHATNLLRALSSWYRKFLDTNNKVLFRMEGSVLPAYLFTCSVIICSLSDTCVSNADYDYAESNEWMTVNWK
jgi:hypothetical protein